MHNRVLISSGETNLDNLATSFFIIQEASANDSQIDVIKEIRKNMLPQYSRIEETYSLCFKSKENMLV